MKNKEIEEILYVLKHIVIGRATRLTCREADKLLSYIEQLEADYKEANDSITWWTNRFNAVERDNRDYKSRIDKAIEYVESHFIFNDKTGECYQTHTFDKDNAKKLYDILKGDSDE